jgi:hypothetical protein
MIVETAQPTGELEADPTVVAFQSREFAWRRRARLARSRVPEVRVQERGRPVLGYPNAGRRRRGAGVRLPRQQARTLEEVRAGVDEFIAGHGPMLLDIRVSRSVISVPYSRLWYGVDVCLGRSIVLRRPATRPV